MEASKGVAGSQGQLQVVEVAPNPLEGRLRITYEGHTDQRRALVSHSATKAESNQLSLCTRVEALK